MAGVDRYIMGLVNNLENLTGTLSEPENITGHLANATLRGMPVELRINGIILQWKYEDEDSWTDLIDLSTLDYEEFTNLPTIDGVEIKGEIAEMIISAIQDLLDEKVDKVQGKELSTNDFTNELKSKLDDIENNAQENIIENINVNGDSQTIDNKTVNLTIPTNLLNGSAIGSLRGVNSRTEDEDYTIGRDAVAVGFSTRAAGYRSFAEGYATKSLGSASHSEGYFTISSGDYSHGEGFQTKSTGYSSHTEGTGTTASGTDSHSEGLGTVANHRSQHVFGQYNIADTSENSANDRGDYVEIVGNGNVRIPSNARTLDWDGNEVLAGKLTVGVAPTESMDVTTKGYVDTNISNVSDAIPTNVSELNNDSGYLTAETDPTVPAWAKAQTKPTYTANEVGALPSTTYIPNKVSDLTNDENYQTDSDIATALSSYATTTYVNESIANAIGSITEISYYVCQEGEYDTTDYTPTIQGQVGIIYLVPKSTTRIGNAIIGSSTVVGKDEDNIFYEYIFNGSSFEKIGDTSVDLSDYLDITDISTNNEINAMLVEIGIA